MEKSSKTIWLETFNYSKKNNSKYLNNIGEKPKSLNTIRTVRWNFKITPIGWKKF